MIFASMESFINNVFFSMAIGVKSNYQTALYWVDKHMKPSAKNCTACERLEKGIQSMNYHQIAKGENVYKAFKHVLGIKIQGVEEYPNYVEKRHDIIYRYYSSVLSIQDVDNLIAFLNPIIEGIYENVKYVNSYWSDRF